MKLLRPHLTRSAASLIGVLAPCAGALAQSPTITWSVDFHGPSISSTAAGGPPVTEADILMRLPGLNFDAPPAETLFTGADLGLTRYSQCVGMPPGTGCGIEVDAMSYGRDLRLENDPTQGYNFFFSVDEFAVGSNQPIPGPSISTGAPGGEISSDLYTNTVDLPPGPLNIPAVRGRHVGTLDGDGDRPLGGGFVYPGLGVVEPNDPSAGVPDLGDTIDAFDIDTVPAPFQGGGPQPLFFSLDAGFADSEEGIPNSDSGSFENSNGADVLVTLPGAGGQPQVYLRGNQIGLDLMGLGTDDLDLLILAENGQPGYQRSFQPYDWLPGPAPGRGGEDGGRGSSFGPGGTDMLLFSVRRGSAVIGAPDSIFGLPIEEGDLLVPTVTGGMSPFPGIFIAAENVGLATRRSDMTPCGDDMNGGDMVPKGDGFDCNMNGFEDSVDIACGHSMDTNMNGVPDECESSGSPYCSCASNGPCGNDAAGSGCENSTGVGATMAGSGTSSILSDDLVLTTTGLPTNKFGIHFMGTNMINVPFGDGRRCVGGGVFRFPIQNSGAGGTFSLGPGLVGLTCNPPFPMAGCIEAGDTWNFQAWYRDPMGAPCGNGFNLSNGWSVTFIP